MRKVRSPDTAHGTNSRFVTDGPARAGQSQGRRAREHRREDLRGQGRRAHRGDHDSRTRARSASSRAHRGRSSQISPRRRRRIEIRRSEPNAVCGSSRPGTWASTSVHTTHKKFSQPRGGGPGGGPGGRSARHPRSVLPVPAVCAGGGRLRVDHDPGETIGRVSGFPGPFGVFVRLYAYMRMGGRGYARCPMWSGLNANTCRAAARTAIRPAVRPPLNARVVHLGSDGEARSTAHPIGPSPNAADGLRLPPADDLFRSPRGVMASDGDGGEGDRSTPTPYATRCSPRPRGGGGAGAV